MNEPIHIVISKIDDATFVKVSRECERLILLGLLQDAVGMAMRANTKLVKPEDCPLQIAVSVMGDYYESQP